MPQPSTPYSAGPLVAAFPAHVADDARAVLAVLPPASSPVHGWFEVTVEQETLTLPTRMYHPEPDQEAVAALTDGQRLILHCLYSRHHDGYVRQRHLEHFARSDEPSVVPFVIQLGGEYVVEIIESTLRALPGLMEPGSAERMRYGAFLAANPAFFTLTERRAVSYWSAYYRRYPPRYREFATYPGGQLITALRAAAEETTGIRWRRHSPA
ncbi:hypothetical protein ACFVIM_13645 [Streptomyces sp. NPDC057638]|uniref:hypothetical protein n=1 Tax=Streptomyces sp. NPDC057638 TaxID=3346190 RepID=UPI0036A2E388